MQRDWTPFTAGGLDERLFPDPGKADVAQNLAWTRGGWQATAGDSLLFATSDRVVSMFWFSQHNGQGLQVVETGTPAAGGSMSVIRWAGTTPTLVAFDTDRKIIDTPWYRTRYLAVNGWLWYANSYNRVQRYNGKRVVPVGFDGPPPPPTIDGSFITIDWTFGPGTGVEAGPQFTTSDAATRQRGVGERAQTSPANDTPRWLYGYQVTWVNDLGQESPPSAVVWVSGASRAIAGTEVAGAKLGIMMAMASPPGHIHAVRVWRSTNLFGIDTVGIDPPVYLCEEMEPTACKCYIDDHPDNELGEQLDTDLVGAVPPRIRLLATFAGCVFAVSAANPSAVYVSSRLRPEQFSPSSVFYLGDQDGGEIRLLHAMRNCLVVAKARGIYIFTDSDTGFRVETLTEELGAGGTEALETPDGLLILSDSGPILVSGSDQAGSPTMVRPLWEKVRRTWDDRVNRDALLGTVATLHRRQEEAWFQVPTGGSVRPTLGLVYHLRTREFSLRESWDIQCFCETRDTRADLFYGNGTGLYHVSQGYAQTRDVAWRSAPTGLGVEQSRPESVVVYQVALGKHTLTVKHYPDRSYTPDTDEEVAWTLNPALGTPAYEGPPVWDSATWSASAAFADLTVTPVRVDLKTLSSAEYQVEFSGVYLAFTTFAVGFTGSVRPAPQSANKGVL